MSGSIRRIANLQLHQLIRANCRPWSRLVRSYSSTSHPPPPSKTHANVTTINTANNSVRHNQSHAKVIFSGIQPTGVPHLGNYLGALRHWVELQNRAAGADRLLYAVVDLHAITAAAADPFALRRWRREMLAALLAIGLDPSRCIMFYQSAVPEHAELMWILSCSASMGHLSRMTQWKSKLGVAENASPLESTSVRSRLKLGLFSYPVLQAADVLLYETTHVPVGEDQAQHLEFARACADSFNAAYGQVLVKPQTLLAPARRIMSLTDPTHKMSKSHADPRSRIHLNDPPADISMKIRLALTDSISGVSYDPGNRPGVSNLLDIMSSLDSQGRSAVELAEKYSSLSMRAFKMEVTACVTEALAGIRHRYYELIKDENAEELDRIAESGARSARDQASKTMAKIKGVVGLTYN